MMYRYAVKLDPEDGGFVVTFPAFPEAVSEGDTRAEAMANAVDCLDETIAARILAREPLPLGRARGGNVVEPSPAIAAKASLYVGVREAGLLSTTQLAQRLGVGETEARRLLDPHHETRLSRLDAHLRALGWRMRVEAIDDAA